MAGEACVVKVDAFAEGVWRCSDYDAIVCVDVITAGTTLVTSVAQGRRTFVARLQEAPFPREVLRATEVELATAGSMAGLGPAGVHQLTETDRPLVLESRLGDLLAAAPAERPTFVACLRNLSATVAHLPAHHRRVAVIAAGVGGELRFEDEMAAAWMATDLHSWGYALADRATALAVRRWARGEVGFIRLGKSAESLRTRGLHRELEFITEHVDDIAIPCEVHGGEVREAIAAPGRDAILDPPPLLPVSRRLHLRAS